MLTKFFVAALPLLAAAAPSQHFLSSSSLLDGHHGEGDTIDLTKYTIGQILAYTLEKKDDPERHTPPLKKLAYVVNRTESIKEYLSDPDISVTLFAPDDKALEFPHHDDGDHEHEHKSDEDAHHEMMMANHPFVKYDEHDHPDDEEKRRFIKKLVTAILHYHISPSKLPISELRDHSTIPTTLNQTRDTDVSFRIRVSPKLEFFPPPPAFQVGLNFYSQVRRGPTLLAKNGIIHLVSAPLLPPLTPLDQLFLFPNVFATLTSAVQQTELDHEIAPYLHAHEDHHESLAALFDTEEDDASYFEMMSDDKEPSEIVMNVLEELVEEARAALPSKDTYKAFPFTIFAPTNSAFAKIPFKIRLFLFSPFGRPILKKLLSYHIVPQFLFHSDYQLNATRSAEAASFASIEALPDWFKAHLPEPGHLAGRHGPPHDGPPHHGSPRDGPLHHGPPHDGPPHGPPHHGGPPPSHGKVNVTKYELPTLLGSGKNESLSVNVYAFRIGFGNGPVIRRFAVGNTEQEEKEYSQVIVGDGVAWGGAVHVIRSLIKPPFVEHHEHDHDGDHEHHGREHKHKHEHKHHDHHHEHRGKPAEGVLAYFKSLWA